MARAGDDHAVLAGDLDRVAAARGREDALQPLRRAVRVVVELAVRADDEVVARAERDRVRARAAEHDVVAVAERDLVGDRQSERDVLVLADHLA